MTRLVGTLFFCLLLAKQSNAMAEKYDVSRSFVETLNQLERFNPDLKIGPLSLADLRSLALNISTSLNESEPVSGSGDKMRKSAVHFIEQQHIVLNLADLKAADTLVLKWLLFHEALGALGFNDENYQLTLACAITTHYLSSFERYKSYYELRHPGVSVDINLLNKPAPLENIRNKLSRNGSEGETRTFYLVKRDKALLEASIKTLSEASYFPHKKKYYEVSGISSVGGGGDWESLGIKFVAALGLVRWLETAHPFASRQTLLEFARFFLNLPLETEVWPFDLDIFGRDYENSMENYLSKIRFENKSYGRALLVPEQFSHASDIGSRRTLRRADVNHRIIELSWKEFKRSRK